jgi:predicted nucleic-acid-binding protein
MIGLDTNVLLRYLLQDDPAHSPQVNRIFEHQLSAANPGFVNLTTVLEIVWVMQGKMKKPSAEIAAHLKVILSREELVVQNELQVFEAVHALQKGIAEFEDALIGTLNLWAGCSATLTFDRKAARLPYFQPIA